MSTLELVFLASPWVEAFLMSGAWIPALGLPLAAWLMDRWAIRKVVCPQCLGEDTYCLYCKGTSAVDRGSAREWHRQNS
jgi:hypothetical protein